MKVSYFPGCTLKTRARNMDEAARAAMAALGVELVEPKRWTCCGVLNPLSDDDIMRFIGPVRNLLRIRNEGGDKVVVTCAMCYNSLARANLVMRDDNERKRAINLWFDGEEDYHGDVEVVHLLQFLRDEIGWDALRAKVEKPLDGSSVAAYYGCTLLRPKEVSIDPNHTSPTILEEFLRALGADVADFPDATRCCSSYQSVSHPEAAAEVSGNIVASARKSGAGTIVTACPLCSHNLKRKPGGGQPGGAEDTAAMPTLYFTEALAAALGVRAS